MNKVLITGGHSTPAFAVLDKLLESTSPQVVPDGQSVHRADRLGESGRKQDDVSEDSFDISTSENISTNLLSRGENTLTTPSSHTREGMKIIWVGEKFNQRGTNVPSAEFKTVTEKYKIPFINIRAGKLVRTWSSEPFKAVGEIFNLMIGFVQSFFIILKHRPTLVLSFGGFLAVPVVFWARIFGAKVVTHEQTIVTGLANKIISKFAHKILVSFESSLKYFPAEKVHFVGNPIRKDVFEVKSNFLDAFDKNLPIIYITGGNQGANEINKRIFEELEAILSISNVVHQTGNSTITNDFQKAHELRNRLISQLQRRYIVKDYVNKDEIGEVMNKADLLVTRAGANSTVEILALGKMAVMIPIPWTSHDEQTKNAKLVEEFGLAKRLVQSDKLTSKDIYDAIVQGLENVKKNIGFNGDDLPTIKQKAKSQVKLDAAERFVEEIKPFLE